MITKFSKNKFSSGFTLIELLVVIAIISLLSSVVLSSLSQARAKARVARTATDLKQIAQAIQRYYLDVDQIPPHDLSSDDFCEKTLFVSGAFTLNPSGLGPNPPSAWKGPYLSFWPTNQWGQWYTWEYYDDPTRPLLGYKYFITVKGVPPFEAQMLDNLLDDGNLSNGVVYWQDDTTSVWKINYEPFIGSDGLPPPPLLSNNFRIREPWVGAGFCRPF